MTRFDAWAGVGRRLLAATLVAAGAALGACDGAPPAAVAPAAGPPGTANAVQEPLDIDTPPPFEVLEHGKGPLIQDGDVAIIHYVVKLTSNGMLVDDTHRVGNPFVFTVGRASVIRGLDLLAPKLHVGDRVKTTIPWRLAYGELGIRNAMPPKADLDYEIDVIGISPTPSWVVIAKGEGREAKPGTKATVHYAGSLPDGEVFDDSRARKEPYTFRVGTGEVIEGWDWIVSRMRQGDHWKVVIPWVYAYGADGSPPKIPPMTDLHFDIEVLGVE